jgi:trehalose/maltose transport system permease protein
MNSKVQRHISKMLLSLIAVVYIIYTIFPLYWAINSSLKSDSQLAMTPATYLPRDSVTRKIDPTFQNYRTVLRQPIFWRGLKNSTIIASAATAISLVLGIMGAFAVAKLSFRGKSTILYLVLSMTMFPQIVLVTGLFALQRALKTPALINLTFADLLFTLPLTIWLLTGYFQRFPDELIDSAFVEGTTILQLFRYILVPMMMPALLPTGLLAFIGVWNEYLFALMFTVVELAARPLTVVIALTGMGSGVSIAMVVLATLPILVPTVLFQKRIVAGLSKRFGFR